MLYPYEITGKMKRKEMIDILSKYTNGGNAFLLFEYLYSIDPKEVLISHSQIAKELNKTRPSIQSALELLQELKILELHYGKIIIKIEVLNG